jgi:hypothetical protein
LPMDETYNRLDDPAISRLHTEARQAVVGTGLPGADYTTISGTACNETTVLAAKAYVDCNNYGGATFPNATHVVFNQNTRIGTGGLLELPVATDVVTRGRITAPQGTIRMQAVERLYAADGIDTTPSGRLAINSTTSTDCVGGVSAEARVVLFGGTTTAPAMNLGNNTSALCAASVYIAGPLSQVTWERRAVYSGGNCSPALPCPMGGLKGASPVVYPGATANLFGTVKWFAPNNRVGRPELYDQGVEDLALWMEGSQTFDVKTGATLEGSGVFYMPNAHAAMSSPTSATPRAAQFIARTLNMAQGTLELQPVATDSIQIPMAGGYRLIR